MRANERIVGLYGSFKFLAAPGVSWGYPGVSADSSQT